MGHRRDGSDAAYEPNLIPCDSIRIKNGVDGMNAIGLGNMNFRKLELEAGVGGTNIDFTGEWKQNADIQIQVGVGAVLLKMPMNIGVRVESGKSFLSGLHLDHFSKRDSYYYSDNYDAAKIRVTIRVVTGIGECRITWA
jgi:predicted membrane protein